MGKDKKTKKVILSNTHNANKPTRKLRVPKNPQAGKKKPAVRLERARPGTCEAQWADKNVMYNPMLK